MSSPFFSDSPVNFPCLTLVRLFEVDQNLTTHYVLTV